MVNADDKKKAVRLVKEAKALLETRGIYEQRQENAKKALPLLDKAIQFDSENVEAWAKRGDAKNKLGDHQGALADCNKAIELNSNNDDAWNNRGYAKYSLNDYQGASADYDKAIEINSQNASALNNRGFIKGRFSDYQGAIADYDKAIKADSKYESAWNNRGYAKNQLENYGSAVADFTQATKLLPNYVRAWDNRGYAKIQLGGYKGAIDDCSKAIAFDPKHASAWHNRGMAKFHLEQYDPAVADLDEALALEPNNVQFKRDKRNIEIEKSLRAEKILQGEFQAVDNALETTQSVRLLLFIILFVMIIAVCGREGLFNGMLLDTLLKKEGFATLFATLPIVSIIAVITTPIIWGIHICNRRIDDLVVLKYDLFSRYNIEEKLYTDRQFKSLAGDAERKEIMKQYIKNWMEDNPSNRLIQHRKKRGREGEVLLEMLVKQLGKKTN